MKLEKGFYRVVPKTLKSMWYLDIRYCKGPMVEPLISCAGPKKTLKLLFL